MDQESEVKHCKFYLERKKRCCRFPPQPKSEHGYCLEHAGALGLSERERIPCPQDPNHYCYADKLQKHLKKCNVTKLRQTTESSEFFFKGVNKGAAGSTLLGEQKNVTVKDMPTQKLADLIKKVKSLYEAHVKKPESVVLEHPSVKAEQKNTETSSCGETKLAQELTDSPGLRKELLQQASLIGQLESLGLLNGTSWFVELGAGKGNLSHWVERATHNKQTSFLLVDRSSVRYKKESAHNFKEDGSVSKFKRIRTDISDLCLGYVTDIAESDSVVVMSKHLCGAATDLGIRCAVDSLQIHRKSALNTDLGDSLEPPSKAQKLDKLQKRRVPKGVMIALCCHHRCEWDTYVGQRFMQTCGVTPEDFDLITRLSSWAVCAKGRTKPVPGELRDKDLLDSDANVTEPRDPGTGSDLTSVTSANSRSLDTEGEHSVSDLVTSESSKELRESLSVSAREEIGRMCKRLIDTGRLHYIHSKGMACYLRQYVTDDITPENVVLLAHCGTDCEDLDKNKS